MPVEVAWCDVCFELTCEDQQVCDEERKRLAAVCDVCGESHPHDHPEEGQIYQCGDCGAILACTQECQCAEDSDLIP